jgi:hypothetical protein|tara:strand:- start:534 stop:815 length:282 start_codon:yes stop_codon:yes gene_type:complete
MMNDESEELEEIYHDEEVIVIDGLDKAFLGFAERYSFSRPIAVYDRDVCIRVIANKNGFSDTEAEDFFQANVLGTWFGDQTPIFVTLEPITQH